MTCRDSLAANLSPILLRLALGVTFVWAGLGKVLQEDEVQGADAAILANLGLVSPPGSAGLTAPPPVLMALAQPAVTYTAEQFPTPVKVKQVHTGVTLTLWRAANPGTDESGKARMALWPAWAARGRTVAYVGWGVAGAELLGGLFVLLGLMTGISSLALAGTMAGAIWLTTIGPAIQSGRTVLGFLPDHAAFAPAWIGPLWQFALLCAALGLAAAGSGAMAFDRLLFAPAPPPPKPAPKPAA